MEVSSTLNIVCGAKKVLSTISSSSEKNLSTTGLLNDEARASYVDSGVRKLSSGFLLRNFQSTNYFLLLLLCAKKDE